MKLVILDRDGVVNHDSDQYIKSPAEWRAIPGSIEAIARLNQNGWRVAVATNQSGIGRGLFDMATLNAINDKMMELVFRQAGASTRCSSARTPRPRNATAASPAPACWRRSRRASTRS